MSTGIMIIGPSGSGKTTLGKIVAQKLGYLYFDVDDYIWKQNTDSPDMRHPADPSEASCSCQRLRHSYQSRSDQAFVHRWSSDH